MNYADAIKGCSRYCEQTIPDYKERVAVALGTMDRERCTIESADYRLADEIATAIEDWCTDNDCETLVDDITEWDIIFNG